MRALILTTCLFPAELAHAMDDDNLNSPPRSAPIRFTGPDDPPPASARAPSSEESMADAITKVVREAREGIQDRVEACLHRVIGLVKAQLFSPEAIHSYFAPARLLSREQSPQKEEENHRPQAAVPFPREAADNRDPALPSRALPSLSLPELREERASPSLSQTYPVNLEPFYQDLHHFEELMTRNGDLISKLYEHTEAMRQANAQIAILQKGPVAPVRVQLSPVTPPNGEENEPGFGPSPNVAQSPLYTEPLESQRMLREQPAAVPPEIDSFPEGIAEARASTPGGEREFEWISVDAPNPIPSAISAPGPTSPPISAPGFFSTVYSAIPSFWGRSVSSAEEETLPFAASRVGSPRRNSVSSPAPNQPSSDVALTPLIIVSPGREARRANAQGEGADSGSYGLQERSREAMLTCAQHPESYEEACAHCVILKLFNEAHQSRDLQKIADITPHIDRLVTAGHLIA